MALEKGKSGDRYILGNQNLTLKAILDRLSQITDLTAPQISIPHFIPYIAAWIDERILAAAGKKPSVSVDAVKMARQKMYYDATKAVKELGLPQSPITPALQKAVEWFMMRLQS